MVWSTHFFIDSFTECSFIPNSMPIISLSSFQNNSDSEDDDSKKRNEYFAGGISSQGGGR